MNFLTDYEAPLRSYIEESIVNLGSALEEEVQNCASMDISLLEQQFDRESDNLLSGITQRIHQIRDEIKGHRPTNIQSADYERRMIQYRLFIQSSSVGMNRMTDWINSIFEQVTTMVKWIVQWLAENAQSIVEIIMENVQEQETITGTLTQLIHKKYQHFKTLIFKLKSIECSSNLETSDPDELDEFVDQMIIDLQDTLLANIHDLRQRIKQARPDSNDPRFQEKIILYQQLLEQIISMMENLENIIGRTLDEFQILIGRLWEDISQYNGIHIERLLAEHQQTIDAFLQQQWIKHLDELHSKLNTLQSNK